MSIWPHFPSQWMQSGRFSSFPPKRAVEVDKTGKGWDIHGGHVMSAPRTGEAVLPCQCWWLPPGKAGLAPFPALAPCGAWGVNWEGSGLLTL